MALTTRHSCTLLSMLPFGRACRSGRWMRADWWQAPLGDATQGSPGNAGMYSGTAAQAVTDNFQQSQDTMYSLGGDTGGKALFDNNDLTRGIVQAQQAISDYYIVGYYTTNTAQNGHFRRVKITVNSRPTPSWNIGRATTRTKFSASLTRWTRRGSLKMH